jgi:hypothetical protein
MFLLLPSFSAKLYHEGSRIKVELMCLPIYATALQFSCHISSTPPSLIYVRYRDTLQFLTSAYSLSEVSTRLNLEPVTFIEACNLRSCHVTSREYSRSTHVAVCHVCSLVLITLTLVCQMLHSSRLDDDKRLRNVAETMHVERCAIPTTPLLFVLPTSQNTLLPSHYCPTSIFLSLLLPLPLLNVPFFSSHC